MEQNESNLSFDQLPKAVGELLTKVDYVISRLDEKKDAAEASENTNDDQMMTLDEACQFIGKKRSTMYSLTSERRIPYRKRGNKLYFFQDELMKWITDGGYSDTHYPDDAAANIDERKAERHLKTLQAEVKRKPKPLMS